MAIELDPLFGVPAEKLNEYLKLGGFSKFEMQHYDFEEEGHIIKIRGTVEGLVGPDNQRIFPDIAMNLYSTGSLITIRITEQRFVINEETLSQSEQTIIEESEMKLKEGKWIAEMEKRDADGTVLDKKTFVDGIEEGATEA
tara:strand:+ start:696 stop:1118 length:423 start_codon:yes stop_codon:yes gene_type:complete